MHRPPSASQGSLEINAGKGRAARFWLPAGADPLAALGAAVAAVGRYLEEAALCNRSTLKPGGCHGHVIDTAHRTPSTSRRAGRAARRGASAPSASKSGAALISLLATAACLTAVLPACAAANLPAAQAPSAALLPLAQAAVPPAFIGNWLANAAFVLGIIYIGAKLYMYSRPQPPAHRQFAALDHAHYGLITAQQQADCQAEQTRERTVLRQDVSALVQKLEGQLENLRQATVHQGHQLMARLDTLDKRNEERIGHVYDALNPLAPRIAAVDAALSNHLADHRARKEPT